MKAHLIEALRQERDDLDYRVSSAWEKEKAIAERLTAAVRVRSDLVNERDAIDQMLKRIAPVPEPKPQTIEVAA